MVEKILGEESFSLNWTQIIYLTFRI